MSVQFASSTHSVYDVRAIVGRDVVAVGVAPGGIGGGETINPRARSAASVVGYWADARHTSRDIHDIVVFLPDFSGFLLR